MNFDIRFRWTLPLTPGTTSESFDDIPERSGQGVWFKVGFGSEQIVVCAPYNGDLVRACEFVQESIREGLIQKGKYELGWAALPLDNEAPSTKRYSGGTLHIRDTEDCAECQEESTRYNVILDAVAIMQKQNSQLHRDILVFLNDVLANEKAKPWEMRSLDMIERIQQLTRRLKW